MRPVLFLAVLLYSSLVLAQPGDTGVAGSKPVNSDSIIKTLQKRRDSISNVIYKSDTHLQRIQNQNNINYFVKLQKENRERQKKAAMLRIAIGVSLLVLLIVGLRRRRKK